VKAEAMKFKIKESFCFSFQNNLQLTQEEARKKQIDTLLLTEL
jgi:hypothetical protein